MKIDSLFYEFIQLEISTGKRVLGLEQDIIFITDKDHWNRAIGTTFKQLDGCHGAFEHDQQYIFINPKTTRTLKQLKKTIWHELLHARFPRTKEKKIRELTERYVK